MLSREEIITICKMMNNYEERQKAYKIMEKLNNLDMQLIVCYLVGLCDDRIKQLE